MSARDVEGEISPAHAPVSARPLPATERGRRTRSGIITAAAQMMYRNGVAATSLDDILAASGTGKSQLYHYFSDKSDLVRAVIDHQLEQVLAAQPRLDGVDSWVTLRAWADDIYSAHRQAGGPFSCPLGSLAAELKNDDSYLPGLDAAFRRWEEPLRRGLESMKERGDMTPEADAARLAATLVGALQGGMLLAKVAGDVAPLVDLLDAALAHVQSYSASAAKNS